jgi:hypothetical protein
LDETSNSEYVLPDNISSMINAHATLKIRYYHILTQSEIDSTANIEIDLPEVITDIDLLQLRSRYGLLTYGDHYTINQAGTLLTVIREYLNLDVGDILELYVFEYTELPKEIS